ncbi:MAG: OmpA family protein [Novosphingobium sp.]|nr:OmpA family protein [Novosphingobium sp.]
MRIQTVAIAGALVLALGACELKDGPSETEQKDEAKSESGAAPASKITDPDAMARLPKDEAETVAEAFSVDSVPESTATLPAFPLFEPLDGLKNEFSGNAEMSNFDHAYFIGGKQVFEREGKVYHGQFRLEGAKIYSKLEFRRNYENAIRKLGGVKVASDIDTEPFRKDLRRQGKEDLGPCLKAYCTADYYLIRKDGVETWIEVGVHKYSERGNVTVLQTAEMEDNLKTLSASDLKSKLDADGHVPVYIQFDVDRATIKPAAAPAIHEIVTLLKDHPALKLSIEGHTDDTGSAAHNKTLSVDRAIAVRSRLVSAGIDGARLKSAGYGATRPIAQGTSDEARARNRRVELVRV